MFNKRLAVQTLVLKEFLISPEKGKDFSFHSSCYSLGIASKMEKNNIFAMAWRMCIWNLWCASFLGLRRKHENNLIIIASTFPMLLFCFFFALCSVRCARKQYKRKMCTKLRRKAITVSQFLSLFSYSFVSITITHAWNILPFFCFLSFCRLRLSLFANRITFSPKRRNSEENCTVIDRLCESNRQ